MSRYAVVDLETTGNQVDYDEIIQIGISFVENNQIVDQYHSMVKTDLEICIMITCFHLYFLLFTVTQNRKLCKKCRKKVGKRKKQTIDLKKWRLLCKNIYKK